MREYLVAASLTMLLSVGSSAGVVVVDAAMSPGADVPTIGQGVALAGAGDVVLVRGGLYFEDVLVQKPLHLVADGQVLVAGTVRILGVSSGPTSVRGLLIEALGETGNAGLVVSSTPAAVRVEDCVVDGSSGGPGSGVPGGPAAFVATSAAVAFVRCTLRGGGGSFVYDDELPPPLLTSPAGSGLLVWSSSDVVVADSVVRGGHGGWDSEGTSQWGESGGHGLDAADCLVFASGSTFEGGWGGWDQFAPGGTSGDGGDGVHLAGPTCLVRLLDCDTTAGPPGAVGANGTVGAPGAPTATTGGATLALLPGQAQHLEANTPVREGGSLTLTTVSTVGQPVLVWLDSSATQSFLPTYSGSLLVLPAVVLAVNPGAVTIPVPELGPGVDAVTVAMQGLAGPAPGILTSFSVVTALDAGF